MVEVVMALAIAGITTGAVVGSYLFSSRQMEQSVSSTAAEFSARQRLEQVRSAKWDNLADPPVDELVSSNFPVVVATLDLPVAGNKPLYATNTTVIATVSDDPPLKMIRVESVWSFMSRLFTNSVMTYRAPDQ